MTNAECKENRDSLWEAIDNTLEKGLFRWLASGFAAALLGVLLFTYGVSCTANNAIAKGDSNAQLFAAHYKAISLQNKDLKADISGLREEIRDLTKILYEREGVMVTPDGDPLNLPIGFAY